MLLETQENSGFPCAQPRRETPQLRRARISWPLLICFEDNIKSAAFFSYYLPWSFLSSFSWAMRSIFMRWASLR